MTDPKYPSARLPCSWENPVAAAIRTALGVSEDEPVVVTTPQFERPAGWPAPESAPTSWLAWIALFECTPTQLKAMGCGNWDGGLFLFPAEWYDHIPEGLPVETVNGVIKQFQRGVSDNQRRCGCLPYGIRIGPSTDGCDDDCGSNQAIVTAALDAGNTTPKKMEVSHVKLG